MTNGKEDVTEKA